MGLFLEDLDQVLSAGHGPAQATRAEAVLEELVAVALDGAQAAALRAGGQLVAVVAQALDLALEIGALLADELSVLAPASGLQRPPPERPELGPLPVDAGLGGLGRGGPKAGAELQHLPV
jgi:hypothetical protein